MAAEDITPGSPWTHVPETVWPPAPFRGAAEIAPRPDTARAFRFLTGQFMLTGLSFGALGGAAAGLCFLLAGVLIGAPLGAGIGLVLGAITGTVIANQAAFLMRRRASVESIGRTIRTLSPIVTGTAALGLFLLCRAVLGAPWPSLWAAMLIVTTSFASSCASGTISRTFAEQFPE
jgi:hypothetical protein